MHSLLTLVPGRDFRLPEGTVLIRCDAAMIERPGPGGIAIIRNEAGSGNTRIRTQGLPETTTEALHKQTIRVVSQEIGRNRALILTRSKSLEDALRSAYAGLRLINILPASPWLASDATRNAIMAATWAKQSHVDVSDIREIAIYPKEDIQPTTPGQTMIQALNEIVAHSTPGDFNNPRLNKIVQQLIEAAAELDMMRARKLIDDQIRTIAPPGEAVQ